MSRKNLGGTENQEESDGRSSNSKRTKQLILGKSRRRLLQNRHGNIRHSSYESSSILTSLAKFNDEPDSHRSGKKNQDLIGERLPQFTEKYAERSSTPQHVYTEMITVLEHKEHQIQTMRVYRDQLKFISHNSPYAAPIKVNIRLLQSKAQLQSQIKQQKMKILQEIKQMDIQNRNIIEYTQMINDQAEEYDDSDKVLDMGKEKEIMIENIKKQIVHLTKLLEQQKRKQIRERKHIDNQILDHRILIKQKEDKLREVKAKICTHYIRNSSGSRSKDKNMSMSVRRFNTAKNETVRQVFIGNKHFKNYSKEIIEKVDEKCELVKIRFFKCKQKLLFQCMYENKEGKLHTYEFDSSRTEHENEKKEKIQETDSIYIKYLMSMKFFFKSSLVGVECRIKTEKGNKHIQIGICEPHIEYELVTLVNKKLITMGSYWHGKQIIGVSVWFMEESKKNEEIKKEQEKKNNGNSFQEYFT